MTVRKPDGSTSPWAREGLSVRFQRRPLTPLRVVFLDFLNLLTPANLNLLTPQCKPPNHGSTTTAVVNLLAGSTYVYYLATDLTFSA
jgi:hypothetical protein